MTPKQFKEARLAIGISTIQMADALSDPDNNSASVHESTIRRWENGSRKIPSPTIVAVHYMLSELIGNEYIVLPGLGMLQNRIAQAQEHLEERKDMYFGEDYNWVYRKNPRPKPPR